MFKTNRLVRPFWLALVSMIGFGLLWGAPAMAQTLDSITYSTLPGDRVQLRINLSQPVKEPLSFAIDNPARVAMDFPGVRLNTPKRTQNIGVGIARSVTAVEAGGRTRVVLNLVKMVPYQLRSEGSAIYVTLDSADAAGTAAFGATSPVTTTASRATLGPAIQNVDFRRGEDGAARIMVTLSDASTVIDSREEGGKIIVDFIRTDLPERLERKLDVVDFATPVTLVDTFRRGNGVRMVVSSKGLTQNLSYQSDNLYTIDVKPLTKKQKEELEKAKFGYTGQKLSLNFQNIEVRAVLQLIADFTGLNLVASDTVTGSLTLRLKNVPWDQALDIILKTKGLAMRQQGNVVLVAPTEEIAAREKLELEAQKQITELAPLQTEYVQVNYAKAESLAALVKAEENTLLSPRGSVTVDVRTNTLLLRDTVENLTNIRDLVTTLDVPVRQVLIESRIVIADDTFTKDLGVQLGLSRRDELDNRSHFYSLGGGLPGDTTFSDGTGTAAPTSFNIDDVENFTVDLGLGGPVGALKFAIGRLGGTLLQLELQALQAEGRGEVLSNPRVITSNQKEAVIEQGTEIPFQEASSSGATSTSFKKAVLSLKVTPQITPDDRIIMDLSVNQDTIGQVFNGIPSIDTRQVDTQVLVDDGETVVLGGIYEQTTREDITKVPVLGDVPYLGYLFRRTENQDD
ncbi:MAG: type IV pilus secretin PilQ, partial [Gammaproteobacteria bacterium]|nr:type IV pilus secretin PilQ [Gammaproteobacteria bacterium]